MKVKVLPGIRFALLLQLVFVGCLQSSIVVPHENGPAGFLGDQDQSSGVPFRITRVEKTESKEVYRMRVEYEGSVEPVVFIEEILFQEAGQGKPGVVEFDIPKQRGRDSASSITFALADRSVTAKIMPTEIAQAMDLPRVRFQVAQGKDIQLEAGQELKLDFTLDVEGDAGESLDPEFESEVLVKTQEHVIDRATSRYATRRDIYRTMRSGTDVVRLDMTEVGVSNGGHRYGSFVLNSTQENVEGVVDISVGLRFFCPKNCMVYLLKETYSYRFYREGHEGPFPHGFLAFVHDHPSQASPHVSCSVGPGSTDCEITCEAMGENLTGIEISQIGGGSLSADALLFRGDWGMARLPIPDVSFADAGEFLCTARSRAEVITERITLGVVQRVLIDREQSAVTRFENGSLLFTCVAEGVPAPTITFKDLSRHRPSVMAGTHVTHPTQSQTRADLFLASASNRRPGSYEVYCEAQNVDESGGDTRSIYRDNWFYH